MTKSKAGRPGKIQSDFPLQRVSTRISIEAIAILGKQDNIAAFVDEAIKEKGKVKHNTECTSTIIGDPYFKNTNC